MSNLLNAMGIILWQERGEQASQEPVEEVTPASLPPRFIFVAESAKADHALLANIIKALACPEEQAKVLWVNSPTDLAQENWPSLPVIVFGESLYPHAPKNAIRTLSLTALNDNLPAKKSLWQQLKALS